MARACKLLLFSNTTTTLARKGTTLARKGTTGQAL